MIEFKPIPERFFRDPYSALLEHYWKRTGADQIPDLNFRDSKQITNIIDFKSRLIGFFHYNITFHFRTGAVYTCKRSMFVLVLQLQTALLFGCILSTAWIGASDHAVLFVFRWFLKRGSTHGSKPPCWLEPWYSVVKVQMDKHRSRIGRLSSSMSGLYYG